MAYTIISQNNTTTTLADENGNVITVPARSILDAGTTFTLVKINNSTATLEDSNGKIYRDIPCCIDLTRVTGFNVTKVNNNKATLEDTDGNTYAGVPCIVNLTESGGGGSAVIDPLNVTPTTSAQTITASGGVDGYSPVNVSAVDASIDANIQAGNIKDGVQILGVTGNYTGTTPTGTITITSNGITDVTNYANADVQVPTTAPALYREFQIASGGLLEANTTTTHIMSFTGVKVISSYMLACAYFNNIRITGAVDMSGVWSIYQYGCYAAFKNCTGITSIDLSGFTTDSNYSCSGMFDGCTGLTSANLSSLERIISINSCYEMFKGTGLTNINLASLTTVSGSYACSAMFNGCTGLTSANLPALTTVSGSNACNSMFNSCTGLTSANLSALTAVTGASACQYMFRNCTSLATVYIGGTTAIDFGTRTNQFQNMFQSCTQNIDVYAPAANQTQIEAFSGYPNFGGTGTVTWHWRS